MALRKLLEDWINIPLTLEVESLHNKIKGRLIYGLKLPLYPTIFEYDKESKRRIELHGPSYWFVNPPQTIKVRLLTLSINRDKQTISGMGYDAGLFEYTIKKENLSS